MPKQVLFGQKEFHELSAFLIQNGFQKITPHQKHISLWRQRLVPPRKTHGSETGFVYSHPDHNWKVVVWTSFVEPTGKPKPQDNIWVLIKENDLALYFRPPIRRTEFALERLQTYALIAKTRVLVRPCCDECRKYLDIKKGKGLRSRYLVCNNINKHPDKKIRTYNWDKDMPEEALVILRDEREARAKYWKAQRAKGKIPGKAILIRKKWKPAEEVK
ncbi:MAG: hypothetical protein A3A26_00580 [Candidatus Zambryskibacteria bacterium RIFCSPLOWO2_01_FULL_47_14]|uniref:Uncharacterized protein n=1 Tax=Candidatus Zambryskibacteria bacterium RIFCSPLOWO2_01_FULL_47_14 TaxID=1802763 RepID=A0A1G2U6I9_9BACT|nr:MAG: hypothetical protein A3A26_00580 [Candidatus Zambryskibacteria bacterium RIFCSPLOWO2_01_FULL_47_14]